jgi:Flp pilus assembly pilin Flp
VKRCAGTGQSLTEYGLLLALVAAVCIAALQLFGVNLDTLLDSIATALANIMNGW